MKKIVSQAVATFGAIDILVNNAGNDDRHHFSKVTPDYWDARVAVNLRHQFFTAQTVHPQMKAAGSGATGLSARWMGRESRASIPSALNCAALHTE